MLSQTHKTWEEEEEKRKRGGGERGPTFDADLEKRREVGRGEEGEKKSFPHVFQSRSLEGKTKDGEKMAFFPP